MDKADKVLVTATMKAALEMHAARYGVEATRRVVAAACGEAAAARASACASARAAEEAGLAFSALAGAATAGATRRRWADEED